MDGNEFELGLNGGGNIVRWRFGFVVGFVLLVVVAASGCTANDEDVEAAEREAIADFPVMEEALQAFAAKNGEFPRSSRRSATEALSELELDSDITAPTDDRFVYYYSSFADSGGPPCRYKIALVEIRIDVSPTVFTKEHSICDPVAVNRFKEERQADVEAQQESSGIGRALEAYYEQNEAFPVSLNALELEVVYVEAYLVDRDGFSPMSARNGEIVSGFDPNELCRYELWVRLNGVGDRRRTVNNCE